MGIPYVNILAIFRGTFITSQIHAIIPQGYPVFLSRFNGSQFSWSKAHSLVGSFHFPLILGTDHLSDQ